MQSLLNLPKIESTRVGELAVSLAAQLQAKLDGKTKPQGALGRLESLGLQLGLIQKSEMVSLKQPQMVVFAADHGIADEAVSAYPQSVTAQMVLNMLGCNGQRGGAAVNVLVHQQNFNLTVVDAGVVTELPDHPMLIKLKMGQATRNSALTSAMSEAQAAAALSAGMDVVRQLAGNVVAFGEMGIGNSSSAALILSLLMPLPIEQ